MRPADRLLLALRACGPGQYVADSEPGIWHSYCPGCASHILDVRRLRITEDRDGGVRMICSTGCSVDSILIALRVAELYPNEWCRRLADEGRLIAYELERVRADRQLIRAIQGETR